MSAEKPTVNAAALPLLSQTAPTANPINPAATSVVATE